MKDSEVKCKCNATCADDLQQSSDNLMAATITTWSYTEIRRLLILICIQRLSVILHLLQSGCFCVLFLFLKMKDLGGYNLNYFSFY